MKQFFNIVLPMAGRGSRFKEQGYTDSKPFIDVNGNKMFHLQMKGSGKKYTSGYHGLMFHIYKTF